VREVKVDCPVGAFKVIMKQEASNRPDTQVWYRSDQERFTAQEFVVNGKFHNNYQVGTTPTYKTLWMPWGMIVFAVIAAVLGYFTYGIIDVVQYRYRPL
jgi:hypothetical protein